MKKTLCGASSKLIQILAGRGWGARYRHFLKEMVVLGPQKAIYIAILVQYGLLYITSFSC